MRFVKNSNSEVDMIKFVDFSTEMLEKQHLSILRELGRVIGVKGPSGRSKEDLIENIIAIQQGKLQPEFTNKGAPTKIKIDISQFIAPDDNVDYTKTDRPIRQYKATEPSENGPFETEGVLELCISGYGFLRVNNYENSDKDIYVSNQIIRKHNLKRGDTIRCVAQKLRGRDLAALQEIISINGKVPGETNLRPNFDDLIPYYPTDRIKLEVAGENDISLRCIDLFCPLGMGQRGLIVAPPKTGKTTLLKKIAKSIETNYKDIKLIILLIDERPEEVTDFKRDIESEVVFSTFDENPEHHKKAAELVINNAKRLVEAGQNVVILMDSITRLVRAYNNSAEPSGRTLSGGLDTNALQMPKRFFGAARNIENGGSLTILSTALIETGSRMDDVIFEEFKGTGNMEIHLSRELSEKRIFPAIDIYKSGTRKDDLLLSEKESDAVFKLRKVLSEKENATDVIIKMMNETKDNDDLCNKLDGLLKIYNNEYEIKKK